MATFGTLEAGIRYYLAEGFSVSRCRCRGCGNNQIAAHFPLVVRDDGSKTEAESGDLVSLGCDECGLGLLVIVSKFSIDELEHGHDDERDDGDR